MNYEVEEVQIETDQGNLDIEIEPNEPEKKVSSEDIILDTEIFVASMLRHFGDDEEYNEYVASLAD